MGLSRLLMPLIGVYFLPLSLIHQALLPQPNRTTNHLEVSLTRLFQSILMLQVQKRKCLSRDPNLDHFHNEDSDHFPNWEWISPGSLPCSHYPEPHFKTLYSFLSLE